MKVVTCNRCIFAPPARMISRGMILLVIVITIAPSLEQSAKHFEQDKIEPGILRALQDVGYFLRNFKFNNTRDPRFSDEKEPLFAAFPDPPVEHAHPIVRRFCSGGPTSFRVCLQHIHGVSQALQLRRIDDTLTLIRKNGWSLVDNSTLVESANKNCLRLGELDSNMTAQDAAFTSDTERFKFMVSAGYFMCYFTQLREPTLKHFMEPCDNFAACLDSKFGISNGDPRADDSIPYQCASYSFCPDSCCKERHVTDMHQCHVAPSNPCHAAVKSNKSVSPVCTLPQHLNTNLHGIQMNLWNHSCPCLVSGYEWNSRFSSCVDIDECSDEQSAIKLTDSCGGPAVSSCFNLNGNASCVCRWGYYMDTAGQCKLDKALRIALNNFHYNNIATQPFKFIDVLWALVVAIISLCVS